MIRSMTGYGDAEKGIPEGILRVEMKTVNHRYFNAQLRTPTSLAGMEGWIQGRLKTRLSRGHVNFSLRIERDGSATDPSLPTLDLERARRYLALLERMQRELGLPGELEVKDLLGFRDLFPAAEPDTEAPEIPEATLGDVIDEALDAVVRMRESEGRRLQDDLEGRIDAIGELLDRIEEGAPQRLEAERDRLRMQIRELTAADEVDEDRLAREIAYLAEKWDINEEIVRFRAHLDHFRDLLDAPGREPAGKRLGFVVQEMHREANTIGAKSNDTTISHAVVGIKEEIERLREQVENVE